MNAINFCGEVYNTNINNILKILNKILDPQKIRYRDRMFGDEINYEDTDLEIYFESDQYKSSLTDKEHKEYRINGEFFGNYSSAIQALYHSFGLSSYELKILLLVAAPEICDRFVSLLRQAHNNSETNNLSTGDNGGRYSILRIFTDISGMVQFV